jgi:AraC-like DNA-binding protein
MLNLLRGYADVLFDDPVLSASDLRQLLVTHLCDLVAVTLGATRDAAATAEGRGVRAARLREIKTDIEANLAHGDLSPAAVTRRQKVLESYIRKLFKGEETSFSLFVLLTRRLLRAHRFLLDPRGAHRTISSIAFAAGFSDLSYFNRAFKRFYGATRRKFGR